MNESLKQIKHDLTEKTVLNSFNEAKMYSQAGILYFVIDNQGVIQNVNAIAESFLDLDSDELIGKKFLDFFYDHDKPAIIDALNLLFQKGYIKDIECRMNKFSELSWVQMTGMFNSGDSLARIVCSDYDYIAKNKKRNAFYTRLNDFISLKKLNETAISSLLQSLNGILNDEFAGIVISSQQINYKSNAINSFASIFSDFSIDKWHAVYKGAAQITENRKFSSLIVIPSLGKYLSRLPLTAQNSTFDFSGGMAIAPIEMNKQIDGYFYWIFLPENMPVQEDLSCVGIFINSIQNLLINTASPQKMNNIYESDILYQSPFCGIAFVENGIVRKVNEWITDFTGMEYANIEGKALKDFIAPEHHYLLNPDNSNTETTESFNISLINGKNEKREVNCYFSEISKNGSTQEIWYFSDNNYSNRNSEQLLQAKKMESLGLLAGGIVHEFNNLLACILGYSSLMFEELDQNSPYYEDIRQIHMTTEEATDLTSRLLAFAQGGSYIVSELNVNQLINEVASILSRTLNKNIIIRAELEPELYTIKADASQIQQLILQIALNARDAMPNGGKIIFKSKNIQVTENSHWIKQGAKFGHYVQISFNDTGKGMTSNVKDKIFEPHFTTQENASVKGLGLSIVHKIVQEHNGFISVFSETGKGTNFKVHLPANVTVSPKKITFEGNKPLLGKETILLIDDEKMPRDTARKMLTRYGYKVISAESGTEAVSIFKKHNNRIDLIILDTIMPGMNSRKTAAWLRQLNPDVKIIITSGKGERSSKDQENADSYSGHVEKPFQVRPFLQKIRSVLNA